MREVLLSRVEELLLGITCELRPAFAVCDPAGPFIGRGHPSSNVAAWHYGALVPTLRVLHRGPGDHDRNLSGVALAIRFQNVDRGFGE